MLMIGNYGGVGMLIRIYNAIISVLNITGNLLLIWGLNKTGQTKTISFQFIILMSISDLISGLSSLVFLTMVPLKYYTKYCPLTQSRQMLLGCCNLFSMFMLVSVALDRYMRMKFMERYSLVFTKK